MIRVRTIGILLTALLSGCARAEPPRQYPVKGQVLSVDADGRKLVVAHEDIPGFMPAMTMTYPVATDTALAAFAPGDLITATLEVSDAQGTLTKVTKTGTAPIRQGANQTAMATALLGPGDVLPDAALVDQDDRRRSLSEWAGTATLVTFTYSRCPDPTFCPLMDQNFATIQRSVAKDAALKGRVKLISISFDPEHDTPAVLKKHAAARGADTAVWTFLTGDLATVDRLAGRFGVSVIRPGGDDPIPHSLRTTLVGPDGHVRKSYSGNDWTPGAVLADLRAAVTAP
jgi:protein SCO1/2